MSTSKQSSEDSRLDVFFGTYRVPGTFEGDETFLVSIPAEIDPFYSIRFNLWVSISVFPYLPDQILFFECSQSLISGSSIYFEFGILLPQ
jgi:hypothetical protein